MEVTSLEHGKSPEPLPLAIRAPYRTRVRPPTPADSDPVARYARGESALWLPILPRELERLDLAQAHRSHIGAAVQRLVPLDDALQRPLEAKRRGPAEARARPRGVEPQVGRLAA